MSAAVMACGTVLGNPSRMYPPRGRGGHDGDEQVEHDLVGHQVAALLIGGDLAARRAAVAGRGPQHVPRGDVPDAEVRGKPLALGPLAAAGRGEQQQPHVASS